MPVVEEFNFISFNSRQHALYFSQLLKNAGYDSQIISTPKGVALGCGLSVKFSPHITSNVYNIYKQSRLPIVGFYSMKRIGNYRELVRIPLK
ncbi:MAG: DUF3343 domain-containing protein [Caldicoprobacterales bacterium]|jgi:hypothetical protein|nr:DUF3343 domain-containing protein [Clostridiales bacterium]